MAEGFDLGKIKNFFLQKQKSLKEEITTQSYVADADPTDEGIDSRIVVYSDPTSHVAEQYRTIRTNLLALSPDKPLQAIQITSSLRSEGKTITSCNMAFALAQATEKKTLLVDADMRKAAIHKLLNFPKEPGLTEILTKDFDVDHFIQRPVAGGLYVIPAGKAPANPSELLSSSRFRKMLVKLRTEFDHIIFDISPIIPVTDASVLGKQLDGTLLVVKASRTQAIDVERAYSLLKEAQAKPVGAILTGVVTYIPYYLYRYRYIYAHYARPYTYYGP
jgi:succinoglycan biosynthesis transport protein ExoP